MAVTPQMSLPIRLLRCWLKQASIRDIGCLLSAFLSAASTFRMLPPTYPPISPINGLSGTAGATALSLVGLFNLFGSTLFGYLGDHYRKKYLLSGLYLGRSIIISLFLLFPVTETTAMVFGAAIGFLWLATVPLTSGTVAQIFGPRYLSTLYGIVFFSHQVGSFLGVWLGGRIYDATGGVHACMDNCDYPRCDGLHRSPTHCGSDLYIHLGQRARRFADMTSTQL